MSFNIVSMAANDPDLQTRVTAAVYAEALNNPALVDTEFAKHVINDGFGVPQSMFWSVATDVQAAYETGVQAGRGSPGHDADVVTDGQITAAVVAAWPPDPEPVTP